jgi:hypothetical protein
VSGRFLIIALGVVIVIVTGLGAMYQWLVPGLSSSRTEQGAVETTIATWLLHRSVPADAKARSNPLKDDAAETGTVRLIRVWADQFPSLRVERNSQDGTFGPTILFARAVVLCPAGPERIAQNPDV